MKKLLVVSSCLLFTITSYSQRFSLSLFKRPQVAYLGIDNPLTCTVEGISCNAVGLSTSNGTIEKSGGCMYNFRPAFISDSKIIISKKVKDSLIKVGELHIMVRELPDPIASVGGFSGGNIKKEALNVQGGIGAYAPGYLGFELRYSVKNFVITAIRNKEILFFKVAEGNAFTSDIHKLFDILQKDDIITFTLIKVLKADGKEGRADGLEFVVE